MSALQAGRTVEPAADAGSQPSDLLVQRFPSPSTGSLPTHWPGMSTRLWSRIASRSAAARKPGTSSYEKPGGSRGVLTRFEVGVLAPPGVAGIGDAADVFGGQLAVGARTMCP